MLRVFTRRAIAAMVLITAAGAAQAQQKLAVGAYPTNPPFEFKNAQGVFEGFEVDIVTEVAKRLGLTVEIADMGFQALFAATSSGRIDVAISSITITAERLKSQSFSQPYYDADMGLATRKDSPVAKLDDLRGKVVGGLSGSTGEKWAKENQQRLGVTEVKGYNTQQDLLLDLAAGRIAGAISDIPGMEFSFRRMTDLTVRERIRTGDRYGLMIRKDHPLLGKINEALGAMKKDGTLAGLHKKWFGTDAPADSSTVIERPLPGA
jgi:polar amino acid transport system substrate-binding protein